MSTLVPFDANRYRKTVLSKLLRDGVEASDPFEIYDLPLAAAAGLTDAEVEQRVGEVWAFWQKSREHPKYGGLVTALLAWHAERAAALLDRPSRLALAGGADRHRAEVDAQRFLALDAAIERLVERFGGVPQAKVEGLERLAATSGIDPAEVAGRLARVPVLPGPTTGAGASAAPVAPPADVLRQIRADLDEVGQLTGQAAPRSLHDFLGLPPDSSPATLRRRVEAFAARNRERRPDRLRAVIDDLLTAAGRWLADGDPEAYLDALVAQVADDLRPRLAAAVLVEDTLLPDDADHLVGEAEAAGLDGTRARTLVARLAAEAGHPLTAAPSSRRTDPAPPTGRPSSRRPVAGPRPAPPAVDPGPVPASAWMETLSEARRALRGGRLGEARRRLDTARRMAGEIHPPLRAMTDEIEAVRREAADRWAAVLAALPARRHVEAVTALDRLAAIASDEPGPGGQQVEVLRSESRRRVEGADRAVASAREHAGPEVDRALLAVLDEVADHAGALEALQALGVPPPRAVRVERTPRSVVIRWERSSAAGDVRYKVTRLADARVVGRTPGTEIEDGSAPDGPLGVYAVEAVRAGVASPPARSDEPTEPGRADAGPGATVVLARPAVPVADPATVEAQLPRLEVDTSRGRACLSFPVGCEVVRDDGAPLEDLGDGFAVDPRPREGRTEYVLLRGATEVGRASYLVLPSVADLQVTGDRLTFTWPPGCTEVLVEWTTEAPPGETSRKVTNSRYGIDGGVALPAPRPDVVTVRTCTRERGHLEPSTTVPPSARLRLN